MIDTYKKHISALGEVLLTFRVDEARAVRALDEAKEALEADTKHPDELFSAAAYNALATIRTSPEQEKANAQLLDAIADAVAELEAVAEMAEHSEL